MKNKFNKSYKFLSLFSLSNLETYLQELVSLGFEYASNFILTYTISSFKDLPLSFSSKQLVSNSEALNTFFYLTCNYLSRDPFYSFLYSYLAYKFKIKLNQFNQIMFMRGGTSIKNYDEVLLSSLRYGLTYKDFVLSSFKTRSNIIDSSVNIYTSGYLTRKLVEGLRNIHIKDINCKTKYNCICPVTKKIINIPFLCLNNRSVCSFCLNIDCKSNIFMSVNKGVVSGQALGEPSTQMLLRTFHLGASGSSIIQSTQPNNVEVNILDYIGEFSYTINNFNFFMVNNIFDLNTTYKHKYNYYYSKFKCYNNLTLLKFNLHKSCISLYNHFIKIWSLTVYKGKSKQLDSLKKNLNLNYSPIKIYSY